MEYAEVAVVITKWRNLLLGKSVREKILLTKSLLREVRTQLEILESNGQDP
jgi:hypothetical protein